MKCWVYHLIKSSVNGSLCMRGTIYSLAHTYLSRSTSLTLVWFDNRWLPIFVILNATQRISIIFFPLPKIRSKGEPLSLKPAKKKIISEYQILPLLYLQCLKNQNKMVENIVYVKLNDFFGFVALTKFIVSPRVFLLFWENIQDSEMKEFHVP